MRRLTRRGSPGFDVVQPTTRGGEMTDERKIEERLKALEKKVAELEKALA